MEGGSELWKRLRDIFTKFDADGSGDLDPGEMAAVLKEFNKDEGTLRSAKTIEAEVLRVIGEYDKDGSNTLSVCTSLLFL